LAVAVALLIDRLHISTMSSKQNVSSSGIVVDSATGERHIPASTRPDGTKRREIRVRPGYRPPEDVEVYKNRSAEAWKNRGSVIPGAEGLDKDSTQSKSGTAASNKNAKKREAKKRAKAAGAGEDDATSAATEQGRNGVTSATNGDEKNNVEETPVDAEAEKEKKARNLKKKLRQARELREKKDKGESLLPEQFEKVIKINELIRQLDALGFDADGEKKGVEG
jgi:partner of Y14 and mago protein